MSLAVDSERIDTLLALALAFQEKESDEEASLAADDETKEPGLANAGRMLLGLDKTARKAAQERLDWYARQTRERQERWLARTLTRARAGLKPALLDEHIHVSHIVEALRAEPARVQSLILHHLPARTAADVMPALNLGDSPSSQTIGINNLPAPEIVGVIQRTFLAHFVAADELRQPTALDALSGVELARLVRLAGVRETARACRGITAVEAVASFLRRFAAEDARAIVAHIAMLTSVEPPRVRFAEELIHAALTIEPETGAMLDRAGMQLLAISMTRREEARINYTLQKFPLVAAHTLRQMIEDNRRETVRDIRDTLTGEIEELATSLHHTTLKRPKNNYRHVIAPQRV